MSKVLTLSVAAYNVEEYLMETLSSLIGEGVTERLEVFVIDDGGTDGSLGIAKAFEARYPDTFHAVHKENGGYGSTVQYGIDHATGRYFKLLDGDDWMDTEGLQKTLDLLESCTDDVVITDFWTGPDRNHLNRFPMRQPDGTVLPADAYDTTFPHGMWALFYRTALLKTVRLDLPLHTLYTDQIYSTLPFAEAKTLRFSETPVYCYRIGREAQSTSAASRVRHAEEMFSVCERLYAFYDAQADPTRYLLARVSRYYVVAIRTLLLMPHGRESKRRLIAYERRAREQHPAVYAAAESNNRMGRLIALLRRTDYRIYPLLRLLPQRMLL